MLPFSLPLDLAIHWGVVPKKTDYVALALATGVQALMFANHSAAQHGHPEDIDYLEDDLHALIAKMGAISLFVQILEGAVMDEGLVIMALLRSATVIWLGVWEIHMGYAVYGDDNQIHPILPKPDPRQEIVDMIISLGYLIMSIFLVSIIALADFLYFKLRQRNGSLDVDGYSPLSVHKDIKD